jgi:hypothetical protein
MKFKIDENLPAELLDDLHVAGHEAETVFDEALTDAPDAIVLESMRREGCMLLTMDKGIADVRAYPPTHYAGIILIPPLHFRARCSPCFYPPPSTHPYRLTWLVI